MLFLLFVLRLCCCRLRLVYNILSYAYLCFVFGVHIFYFCLLNFLAPTYCYYLSQLGPLLISCFFLCLSVCFLLYFLVFRITVVVVSSVSYVSSVRDVALAVFLHEVLLTLCSCFTPRCFSLNTRHR